MTQTSETALPPAVLEIGKMHFAGNIIPHEWYSHLRLDGGKPDLPAIIILSEIVYWYRPQRYLSEDGTQVFLRKKFQGDQLQTNAAYYENKFGLTKDQTRKALKRLEDRGLIKREYREINANGIRLVNRMFIEPLPDTIAAITYPEPISGSASSDPGDERGDPLRYGTLSPPGDTLSPAKQTSSLPGDTLSPVGNINTEITTEITTEKTSENVVDDNQAGAPAPDTPVTPSTTLSESNSGKVDSKKRKKTPRYPIPNDW